MSSKNIFSDIFKQLDGNNSVYINNLMPTRDYVWVSDVVNAIICSEEKKLNEIFNIGTGVSTSVEGLINLILKILNKSNVEILSNEKNYTKSIIKLDIEKTKKMLCWVPQVSLKSGFLLGSCGIGNSLCRSSGFPALPAASAENEDDKYALAPLSP